MDYPAPPLFYILYGEVMDRRHIHCIWHQADIESESSGPPPPLVPDALQSSQELQESDDNSVLKYELTW